MTGSRTVGAALFAAATNALRAGDLEGVIVRIYGVIAAADDLDPEVGHRVAGEHAALDGLGDARLDRRGVLRRDVGWRTRDSRRRSRRRGRSARRRAGRGRTRRAGRRAACDADELVLALGAAGDGLAVRDLRVADARLRRRTRGAGGRRRSRGGARPSRRSRSGRSRDRCVTRNDGSSIARRSSASPDRAGVLVGLGLDDDADHRRRDAHRVEQDRGARIAQRVAGARASRARPIAGATIAPIMPVSICANVLAVVREHPHEPADLLELALGRVEHRVADAEAAGVDADERELAAARRRSGP